ncbi:hypothetical protein HZS_6589 [Henneguya salminicola]|nr:hypothetical protein HZS_6589 [Henneguya salminicola]
MDNARFYYSQAVKSILNQSEIAFKYLPGYSLQRNPIEEFFSMIKARYVDKKDNFKTIAERRAHVFDGNFRNECNHFWLNMLTWIGRDRRIY